MYYITITFLAFLYSTSLVAGRYDASQRYTRDLYTRNLGARDAVPEALAEAYAEAIAEANARAFAELQPAHIFARGKQDKVDKVEADRDICLKVKERTPSQTQNHGPATPHPKHYISLTKSAP